MSTRPRNESSSRFPSFASWTTGYGGRRRLGRGNLGEVRDRHRGVCGDPNTTRGQDRYGCSNHVMSGACSNSRGIRRVEIEERVLAGLRDKLMAPEAAAEARNAYVEETNRVNRERRALGATDRQELAELDRKIKAMVYRRKVEWPSDAIQELIERIVLTPGEKRGDLGTIPEWAGSDRGKGATDTLKSGMSVSVVAGAGF